MYQAIELILKKYGYQFKPVVPFSNASDKLLALDLSKENPALTADIFQSTDKFADFIQKQLSTSGARYAIGGYLEKRELYRRSPLFDSVKTSKKIFEGVYMSAVEPDNKPVTDSLETIIRSIHLGVDIWGPAGTPVLAPIGGSVHSLGFNNHFGDYGGTIILQHQLDGLYFHTLYGHLSKADLAIGENQYISLGEKIGHFGPPEENGQWPPHLHFQLIMDMELKQGDYPGVCYPADLPYYKKNCPDPDLILNFRRWATSPAP